MNMRGIHAGVGTCCSLGWGSISSPFGLHEDSRNEAKAALLTLSGLHVFLSARADGSMASGQLDAPGGRFALCWVCSEGALGPSGRLEIPKSDFERTPKGGVSLCKHFNAPRLP